MLKKKGCWDVFKVMFLSELLMYLYEFFWVVRKKKRL